MAISNGSGTAERKLPLTLVDQEIESAPAREESGEIGVGRPEFVREERALESVGRELAIALEHLERALHVSRATGFSGRVREVFERTDELQREAAREFGRKVGDRLGREQLWRVRKGILVD